MSEQWGDEILDGIRKGVESIAEQLQARNRLLEESNAEQRRSNDLSESYPVRLTAAITERAQGIEGPSKIGELIEAARNVCTLWEHHGAKIEAACDAAGLLIEDLSVGTELSDEIAVLGSYIDAVKP